MLLKITKKYYRVKLKQLNLETSIIIAGDHATESSKFKRNHKLLNVWYKSNVLNDLSKDCSQYFEISKFFTGQKCNKIDKNENEIIGRGENFPSFNAVNSLILNLIKKSQK